MKIRLIKRSICAVALGGCTAFATAVTVPVPAEPARAATELGSLPTADAAQRAAASALWGVLRSQPQDVIRTAERLRGLEAELGSLRSLSDWHRAEILAARESLQAAQSQRRMNLAVATLLALLVGSGAAFVWHRMRRSRTSAASADSWYGPLEPGSDGASVVEPDHGSRDLPAAAPRSPVTDREAAPMVRAAGPSPEPSPIESPPTGAAPPAPPVAFRDPGGLKVEALHGAQQQSEFFASLGQVDETVSVLKSYLEENNEQPVLVYLELFRAYHGAGMRVAYEELQTTFRQAFGMDVAGFADYREEQRELDLYLGPVSRIAAAWPSERSQDIIAELLFKRPATPRDLLSAHAYRDLLWLYMLGQEVVHNKTDPAGLQLRGDRGLVNDHFILPWAVGEQEGPTDLTLERLSQIEVAPRSSAFAVDIDLGSMHAELVDPTEPGAMDSAQDNGPGPVIGRPAMDATDAFDAVMESESRRTHR